ncbi:peptidoglycan-binding domain-containing protein [Enorma phocaeensis]|uniref:peptidoglycan-binding domain-containing protein n=1 Tax=Enorma phocaeensis TaxID=1871019 RepID=UPI00195AC5AE|nr:peptidoglycan-binding protein [Enorma phocaeensis]MBM6953221.1 peptidoglycan-binding protein [Enorma phocaeensis]
MEPIVAGMRGPAVEDVQARLTTLGYQISQDEVASQHFGPSTGTAVRAFRVDSGLAGDDTVDMTCWSKLVDASYRLGDRTLYLRLPNFHGADVLELQHALNALGFSCGEADGYFGPHTEAALQQFQENVGLFADGMAFSDTFSYIDRLRHVWEGKPSVSEAELRTGFARAASVLERYQIAVVGEDPIARNVASRMWNIASATTETSGMQLCDNEAPDNVDLVLEIASEGLPDDAAPRATIVLVECVNVSQRIRTALAAAASRPARLRIELTGMTQYGSFTSSDAQGLAVMLLDGVCDALSD